MIQGINAYQTWPVVGFPAGAATGFGIVAAESSWLRSAGEAQIFFGCQTCRRRTKQAIEIKDAPMSTIQGLIKFEIKNWGIAKETPQRRMAGHICIMPRKPAKAQISQKGTMSEKNGNCLPTIAPSR